MEGRRTIFNYLGQVFTVYGVTILLLNVLCMLVGQDAQGYSAMFALGAEGLSVSIMLQFLLVIAISTAWNFLFFSDKFFQKMSMTMRIIGMLLAVLLTIVFFIPLFGWFPVDLWQAWVGFFVGFSVCTAVSIVITLLKTKIEDRKLEEALQRAKSEEYGEEENLKQ